MDEKLKLTEQLLTLVDERDLVRLEYNRQIANMLIPTMLTAVVELLELPTDQIEWVDIEVQDTVLVLTMSVTYNPATDTSPFLGTTSTAEAAVLVQKNLRVGVPVDMLFMPAEEIKTFLQSPKKPESVQKPDQFDPSQLTKEQIQQMMLFQHLSQGTQQ